MRNERYRARSSPRLWVPVELWIRLLALATAVSLGVVVVSGAALVLLGVAFPVAVALAVAAGVLHFAFQLLHGATLLSGWFPSRARVRLLTAFWVGMIVVLAAGGLAAITGASVPVVIVGGLAVGAAAVPLVHRSTRAGLTTGSRLPRQLRSLADVDPLLQTYSTQLGDPTLTGDARIVAEIGQAEAQADAALRADRPDHLDDALTVLDQRARDTGLSHALRFRAACVLVEARDLQAERNRDDHGYLDALQIQREIAAEPGAPTWEGGRALHDAGEYHIFRAREAGEAGHNPVPDLRAALDAFHESRHIFGPGADFEPLLQLKIAQTTFNLALVERGRDVSTLIDREIENLRHTLPMFRGRRRTGREFVKLSLAHLLLARVNLTGQAFTDLEEAERLCRRLTRRGVEIRGMAHELLAQATELRHDLAELSATYSDTTGEDLAGRRVRELQKAFEGHRDLSVADSSEIGLTWARAAAETGDAHAAADAYARVSRQISTDVLRRLDFGKRAALVAMRQGTATEAGFWLARTGRTAEAVTAIEDARAILLGLRAQRLPDDLARRLGAAGRADLFEIYRSAVEELGEAERRQHSDDGGDRAASLRSWSRFDRITREIQDVLGDDIGTDGHAQARRAAADGAVVYLASAKEAGYALVVPAQGDIVHRELPGATHRILEDRLADIATFQSDPAKYHHVLTSVLEWAWTSIMGPLTEVIPAGSTITLVPLGGLGLVPLHGAGNGEGHVDDRLVVRYAPSARMALRAQLDVAASMVPSVVAASAPTVPGFPPLLHANNEVRAVCGQYGRQAHPLFGACHDETLTALGAASVWHLACHGQAVAGTPLDSRLVLTDRSLTLREMIARTPGSHRLAVLSACESGVPDGASLDEVIGFPGALLQAGVAGVVASSWRVRDGSATALVLCFHELWRAGHPPAVALMLAQRWLKTATNGELCSRFGGQFGPLPGTPPHRLERWRSQRPFEHPRHWAAFTFTGA